ncbi:alpha/beta hydrolase [Rhodoferax sp.]|uniref:alpha/beta fold hydrolase n=1 Tax=Rhodoferax sp. TaxID=50421 RepID=UPI0026019081|nr:alpha/beta hydrolase [Rhodoferax sp.]MDD2926641.1 alpha/beta hydrolase [Rhodoferax sp.]
MNWFENFELRQFAVNGTQLHARVTRGAMGRRPALLLLHGFPQSHVMWHRVAARLVEDFDLVLPDLRGYGDSAKAPGLADHSNYSKRTLAQDLVALMESLGIQRFGVCGHDRGGRVAHRLALDHPERVSHLAVIDIAPTLDMYDATDFEFARHYYHWFHLIQPSPLPELMIGGNALAYLHHKLGGWGTGGLGHIEPAALAEYERCFGLPGTIHAMCEDYRASAGIDLAHDRSSRAQGQKIACDTLVLWGERGVVQRLFKPLALWQAQCAGQVTGAAVPAGHFIPEELPEDTAHRLRAFFSA